MPDGAVDPARLGFGKFRASPQATMAGAQFFYDQSQGALWTEFDGTEGAYATQLLMPFDNHPLIDSSDLIVGQYQF